MINKLSMLSCFLSGGLVIRRICGPSGEAATEVAISPHLCYLMLLGNIISVCGTNGQKRKKVLTKQMRPPQRLPWKTRHAAQGSQISAIISSCNSRYFEVFHKLVYRFLPFFYWTPFWTNGDLQKHVFLKIIQGGSCSTLAGHNKGGQTFSGPGGFDEVTHLSTWSRSWELAPS